MVERVQSSHTTTLFVASVADARFGPADGTATLASSHPHNKDLTDAKVAGVSERLVGSRGDGVPRTQQELSGRKT